MSSWSFTNYQWVFGRKKAWKCKKSKAFFSNSTFFPSRVNLTSVQSRKNRCFKITNMKISKIWIYCHHHQSQCHKNHLYCYHNQYHDPKSQNAQASHLPPDDLFLCLHLLHLPHSTWQVSSFLTWYHEKKSRNLQNKLMLRPHSAWQVWQFSNLTLSWKRDPLHRVERKW